MRQLLKELGNCGPILQTPWCACKPTRPRTRFTIAGKLVQPWSSALEIDVRDWLAGTYIAIGERSNCPLQCGTLKRATSGYFIRDRTKGTRHSLLICPVLPHGLTHSTSQFVVQRSELAKSLAGRTSRRQCRAGPPTDQRHSSRHHPSLGTGNRRNHHRPWTGASSRVGISCPSPWWCATCRLESPARGKSRGLCNTNIRAGYRRSMVNSLPCLSTAQNKYGRP